MTEIEQLLHDSEQATPETRRDLLLAFLVKPIEPKSSQPIGVWIEGESVWAYRGSLPVVIQFAKPSPEYTPEPMAVSRCPPCERRELMSKFPSRKVKRWLVLPA